MTRIIVVKCFPIYPLSPSARINPGRETIEVHIYIHNYLFCQGETVVGRVEIHWNLPFAGFGAKLEQHGDSGHLQTSKLHGMVSVADLEDTSFMTELKNTPGSCNWDWAYYSFWSWSLCRRLHKCRYRCSIPAKSPKLLDCSLFQQAVKLPLIVFQIKITCVGWPVAGVVAGRPVAGDAARTSDITNRMVVTWWSIAATECVNRCASCGYPLWSTITGNCRINHRWGTGEHSSSRWQKRRRLSSLCKCSLEKHEYLQENHTTALLTSSYWHRGWCPWSGSHFCMY